MIKSSQNIVIAHIATSTRDRMLQKASEAAALFESRWTMNALLREAPDLHEAIEDQLSMFHESLVTGEDKDIIEHGEAMCRGWAAAIVAMEKSGIAIDALHIGQFGDVTIVVGRQQKAPQWFREQYGDEVVWLTPREVAAMFFQIRHVQEVKRLWPDAEIAEVRSKEVAK